MSTYEESSVVNQSGKPKGYVIRYHELRGYDSPDRWFLATTVRGRSLGEFATFDAARAACVADKKARRR